MYTGMTDVVGFFSRSRLQVIVVIVYKQAKQGLLALKPHTKKLIQAKCMQTLLVICHCNSDLHL